MSDSWWIGSKQLDPDQKKIVTLPLEGQYLVTGPPGCGKTNLLLLRANYLVRAGLTNLFVIVLTRTLREFLLIGSGKYAFDRSRVKTLRQWSRDLLLQYGITVDIGGDDYLTGRAKLSDAVRELVETRNLTHLYDSILLDEAHDYLPSDTDVFLQLTPRLFAVADPRQKIYRGPDALSRLHQSLEHYPLKYHYRIGLRICRVADAIAKDTKNYSPLEPTCSYDEVARPSSVNSTPGTPFEQQIASVITSLRLQREAYPNNLLGVLAPKNEDVAAFWQALSATELAPVAVLQTQDHHEAFRPETRICVTSIHSAKGLEFTALNILGADGLSKFPLNRNLSYTAVTRAKTSLEVYSNGSVPGYLEKALAVNKPKPQLPDLEDAFGPESCG